MTSARPTPGSSPSGWSLPAASVTKLTGRAVLLSALSVVLFTAVGNVSVLQRYEIPGTGYLPRGVVFYLLLLLAYNRLIAGWLPRLRLRRFELIAVFCALLAMDGIPSQDFAQHFYLNHLGLIRYSEQFATSNQPPVTDYLPARLLLPKDPSRPVIKWAYLSLPPGETIPWRDWLPLYRMWTPYIFALYWFLLWCAALIAPHWEKHERLLFPLMQIQLDVLDREDGSPAALLRNRHLWITFAVVTGFYLFVGLHAYFPAVPEIKLSHRTGVLFPSGPARTFNNMLVDFRPEMIGIAYLLTAEVGFSLWFFFFFRKLEIMGRTVLGVITPHNTFLELQVGGGYVVLALLILWSARHYLRRSWQTARHGGENSLFYRFCFAGIALGLGSLFTWCRAAGLSSHWILIQFLLFALASLVASRVICEAGMFLYSSPLFGLGNLMFKNLGTYMSKPDMCLLTATSWVDLRNSSAMAMPFFMQAFKAGDAAKLSRLSVALLMMGSVVLSVLVCHVVVPWTIYHAGVGKLAPWPQGSGLGTVNRLVGFLNNPGTMTREKWVGLLSGGTLIWFLTFMRSRFLWWPVHPLGFVASLFGWPIDRYWFCIFLGWTAKVITLRFGGHTAYRAGRPVAIGLVLGLCFVMTLWMILHYRWPAAALIYD